MASPPTPVSIDGQRYPSLKAAMQAVKLGETTLCKRLDSRDWPGWRRLAKKRGRPKQKPGKPVTFGGVRYPSMRAAARASGVSVTTIRRKLALEDYPDRRGRWKPSPPPEGVLHCGLYRPDRLGACWAGCRWVEGHPVEIRRWG